MDIPIIGTKPEAAKTIEVCRSFSYKLNLKNADGSPAYEDCQFFASRKMECSVEAARWVSQELFEECVTEVRESIALFLKQRAEQQQRRASRPKENAA